MAKQTINIGTSPNDGTGTPLRTSFDYTNQNFTELYTALGGGVGLPGATTQVIFNDGGTNLAGDSGLTFNKTTDTLSTARITASGDAIVCSSTGDFYVGTTISPQFKVERATGNATITGDLTVDTSTLKVDSTNNRVGIGTASPTSDLDIFRASGSGITSGISLRTTAGGAGDGSFIKWLSGGTGEKVAQIDGVLNGTDVGYLSFQCGNGADAMAEQYRIASSGIFTWYDGAGGTRMTLNSSGNLLIGAATAPFASRAYFEVTNTQPDGTVVRNSNATVGLYWRNSYVNSSNTYHILNQSGTGVYLTDGATSWTGTSDERLKDILEPIENAVSKVASLRSVIGKYKNDSEGTRRSFLIAQDVQSVLPEAVDSTNTDALGVRYTEVIPLLVAAIKELTARVQMLESK